MCKKSKKYDAIILTGMPGVSTECMQADRMVAVHLRTAQLWDTILVCHTSFMSDFDSL